MEFGRYLAQLRALRKLSLRKASTGIGISAMYLSEVESGKKKPSEDVLEKMSAFYNVEYTELLAKAQFSGKNKQETRKAVARIVYNMPDEKLDKLVSILKGDKEFGE
jgi:transcriptional regulator with XRE-family HTH domain